MVLVEYIVIFVTCIFIMLWLCVSRYQTQRALKWWYYRQSQRFSQEAEIARNGLLQESFSLQRNLELWSVDADSSPKNINQYYLNNIKSLYHSVNELINQLSPPYIDDSLPLAIQYLVSTWKTRTKTVDFVIQLSQDYRQESEVCSRIVLLTLEELLQVVFSQQAIPQQIAVSLISEGVKSEEDLGELVVEISYQDVIPWNFFGKIQELIYLSRAFRFLVSGKCSHSQNEKTVIWKFLWKNSFQY
jgi:hypothetical protein